MCIFWLNFKITKSEQEQNKLSNFSWPKNAHRPFLHSAFQVFEKKKLSSNKHTLVHFKIFY